MLLRKIIGIHPHIPLPDQDLSLAETDQGNTNVHAQRTSYDDWEWDVIGGGYITRETNDGTWTQEQVSITLTPRLEGRRYHVPQMRNPANVTITWILVGDGTKREMLRDLRGMTSRAVNPIDMAVEIVDHKGGCGQYEGIVL